ncbi:MAG: hypothetical protein HND52_08810 [Ignavibacteriae bacterium]|nr:hypothetical protein [Ignavibacteriota bacterium]NOG98051.1 hypothetical protein [Ignavibacteriota bacterium]
MTHYQIRKELHSQISDRFIYTEEYQDMYYFTKLVHLILPRFDEETVLNAVRKCNKEIKYPRKSKHYLKRLSELLTE